MFKYFLGPGFFLLQLKEPKVAVTFMGWGPWSLVTPIGWELNWKKYLDHPYPTLNDKPFYNVFKVFYLLL